MLKVAHEGDKITMIMNMKLIEGELERFTINKGEWSQEMYNWLKMSVNQI
jgi:hypothetical protein